MDSLLACWTGDAGTALARAVIEAHRLAARRDDNLKHGRQGLKAPRVDGVVDRSASQA
jgi:hypothetical protein